MPHEEAMNHLRTIAEHAGGVLPADLGAQLAREALEFGEQVFRQMEGTAFANDMFAAQVLTAACEILRLTVARLAMATGANVHPHQMAMLNRLAVQMATAAITDPNWTL